MTSDIEDLQARVAFQEDLLNSLNTRVAEQDNEIAALKKQLLYLAEKINSLGAGEGEPDDVPPPHY